jgi:hypothetical protein
MKYPWATPGRKVVCIDDGPWDNLIARYFGLKAPKANDVLTIRSVQVAPCCEAIDLRFLELQNKEWHSHCICGTCFGAYEPDFPVFCFRPLDDRKTDISVLTSLLTPVRTKEDA